MSLGNGLIDYGDLDNLNITGSEAVLIDIDRILSFGRNGRRYFCPEKLQDLAQSIKKNKQLAPILIRPIPDREGYYYRVTGERRIKAHELANQFQIKAVIRELTDAEALYLAREENRNREAISVIEDTFEALHILETEMDLTQEEVKSYLRLLANGKDCPSDFQEKAQEFFTHYSDVTLKTFVKDRLRFTTLPKHLLEAIEQNKIEPNKCLLLTKIKDEKQQKKFLTRAISEKMSRTTILAEIAKLTDSKKNSNSDQSNYSKLSTSDITKVFKDKIEKLSGSQTIWENKATRKKLENLLVTMDRLLETDRSV